MSVCLSVWPSVEYIGPKSRTETPRKTKIGTEAAHVTCDSDTTFKVKRSTVKVTRPLYSPRRYRVRQLQRWPWECIERGNLLLVCYGAVCRRGWLGGARCFDAHRGRRGSGAYCGGRPPTACYYYYRRRQRSTAAPVLRSLCNDVCV